MRSFVTPISIVHVDQHLTTKRDDLLAVEEPLEIRLGFGEAKTREQLNLAVTMRTPGNDFELALGFLYTEGIIDSYNDVASIHYCENVRPEEKENVVRVELKDSVRIDPGKLHRNFYTTSSCGVCGKSSIAAIRRQSPFIADPKIKLSLEVIHTLPAKLNSQQTIFEHTGGLHAVAVFDPQGQLIAVREDVGRHNAFDKIAGEAILKNNLPLCNKIILLSGRASFELVQKAAMVGVSIIVAVGAPSSLAVSLASEFGITLVGFARNGKFNIYTGGQRIISG